MSPLEQCVQVIRDYITVTRSLGLANGFAAADATAAIDSLAGGVEALTEIKAMTEAYLDVSVAERLDGGQIAQDCLNEANTALADTKGDKHEAD